MFDRVSERIGLRTGWRFLSARQQAADLRQPAAQPLQKVVNGLQGKRQAQPLGRGVDAGIGQEIDQKLAQRRGADGVARQNVSQENGKSSAASAALSAIGAKDPLASRQEAAIVLGRIVAVEDTVPVQRLVSTAAWTALLFKRKNSFFSFSTSATKRGGCDMGVLLPQGTVHVENFL